MVFKRKSFKLKDIINSSDDVKVKVIKDRYNYDLSTKDLFSVVCSISNDYLKKDIINYLRNQGFSYFKMLGVICSINDDAYKDNIVKNYVDYDLDGVDAIGIVRTMSPSFIKSIVNNHLTYSFTDRDIAKFVSFLDDDDFKKEVISNYKYYCFDNEDIASVVASLSSDQDKVKFINNDSLGSFDSYCKSIIVASIKNDRIKFSFITNYKEYGFTCDDISYIISNLEDKDIYVSNMVNNYEQYGFNNSILASIICFLSDFDKEKILLKNTYKLSPLHLCVIIKSFASDKKREELLEKLYSNGYFGDLDIYKNVSVSPDMTVGIEIECEGINSMFVDNDILLKGWDIHEEASLNRGTEVVSPVLHSVDTSQIVKTCALLECLDQKAGKRCAGHIHIGADYFNDDVDNYKVLLEIFVNMEKAIYLISNPEGSIPRSNVFMYSTPVTDKIANAMFNSDFNFDDITDMDNFIKCMHNIQLMFFNPRYFSINFENLRNDNKNTIEFRMPNGTIDADTWIDNINLFGNLVSVSKRIADIRKKAVDDMTENDMVELYFYEKIKDSRVSDRNKLKCLLHLFPSSIKRSIYLNRYDVNCELIKGLDMDDKLSSISAFRPINITNCDSEFKEKIISNYVRNHNINKRKNLRYSR